MSQIDPAPIDDATPATMPPPAVELAEPRQFVVQIAERPPSVDERLARIEAKLDDVAATLADLAQAVAPAPKGVTT
jgi:hypothetical protein